MADKTTLKRCNWCTAKEDYMNYHDTEWGVPSYDDRHLFEKFCLEGQQAGISWYVVLKKRENYRLAFDHFDVDLIAKYDQEKIEHLLLDKGLIRNRLKLNSIVKNARAVLALNNKGISFSDYLWRFVDNKITTNYWKSLDEVPTYNDTALIMSKQLKKDGFSFVGKVMCYSLMQSVGMVNDHVVDCFRHEEIRLMDHNQ